MKYIAALFFSFCAVAQAQVPVPVIRPDATITFSLPFGGPAAGAPGAPIAAAIPKGVPATVIKSFTPSPYSLKCFDAAESHTRTETWTCSINGGAESAPSFAVFGDSHALKMLTPVETAARKAFRSGIFAGYSGCPPLQGVYMLNRNDQVTQNCFALNSRYFTFVRNSGIKDVILIAKWSYYTNLLMGTQYINAIGLAKKEPISVQNSRRALTEGLQRTIQGFKSFGARVYLVEQVPHQVMLPADIYEKAWANPAAAGEQLQKLSVPKAKHLALQGFANAAFDKYQSDPSVSIVKLDSIFCKGSACLVGTPTSSWYQDNSHLSPDGAALLEPVFTKLLKERR